MRQFIIAVITFIAMLLMSFMLHAESVDKDDVMIDHTRLKHVGSSSLAELLDQRLIIHSTVGDIQLEGAVGDACNLQITWWEFEPGDGEFYFDNGELKYRTASGKPAAIRTLRGTVPCDISLNLDVGAGHLSLSGMENSENISIASGAGAIALNRIASIGEILVQSGAGETTLAHVENIESATIEAGMGNVTLADLRDIRSLETSTGMGNLMLVKCRGAEYALSSGMGDITILDSEINDAYVSTGMGDIVLQHAILENRKLSTGIGSVIEKDDLH